jgi:hypothetical protein
MMSVDTDTFRDVFRRWPSGLAVVTSRRRDPRGDLVQGMVASSFCSLSANTSDGARRWTRSCRSRCGSLLPLMAAPPVLIGDGPVIANDVTRA